MVAGATGGEGGAGASGPGRTQDNYNSIHEHPVFVYKQILEGCCKTWTLDAGLDRGLD